MVQQKKSGNKTSNIHLVYVTDEEGVFSAFKQVKDDLVVNVIPCLSFIYAVSNKNSKLLFEQELNFLEKRFPQKLLIYKVPVRLGLDCINQEFLEALINSNTSEEMTFSLFGNREFVSHLSDILSFLGVKSVVISKS
jgi:hypothetical protein